MQAAESLVPMDERVQKVVVGWYQAIGAQTPPPGDLLMVSKGPDGLSGFAAVVLQPTGIFVNGLIGTKSACAYILALIEEIAIASRRVIVLRVANRSAEIIAGQSGYVAFSTHGWVKSPSEQSGEESESNDPPFEDDDDDGEYEEGEEDDEEEDELPVAELEEPIPAPPSRIVQSQVIPRKHSSRRRGGKRGRPKKR